MPGRIFEQELMVGWVIQVDGEAGCGCGNYDFAVL